MHHRIKKKPLGHSTLSLRLCREHKRNHHCYFYQQKLSSCVYSVIRRSPLLLSALTLLLIIGLMLFPDANVLNHHSSIVSSDNHNVVSALEDTLTSFPNSSSLLDNSTTITDTNVIDNSSNDSTSDNSIAASNTDVPTTLSAINIPEPIMTLSLKLEKLNANASGSFAAQVNEASFGGARLTATAKNINKLVGYSIFVQAKDTNNLVHSTDNNFTIAPLNHDNVVGSDISINEWGYSLAAEDKLREQALIASDGTISYSSMSYHAMPLTTDTTHPAFASQATPGSKAELEDDTFILALGANIGDNKPAGEYQVDVIVSLVAQPKDLITYQVIYDANGGGSASGNGTGAAPVEAPIESRSEYYEFTVAGAGNLTRTNYEFKGWSTTSGDNNTVEYTPTGSNNTKSIIRLEHNEADTTNYVEQTLYAVWEKIPVTYTLTYNANGGSNPPAAQTYTTTDDSHTFTVAAVGSMVRSGYSFQGWSTSNGDSNSVNYNAGASVPLTRSNPAITLYAVWKKSDMGGINNGNMNQMTTEICKNTPYPNGEKYSAEYTLIDKSTGGNDKAYTIRKFKVNDSYGDCWMTTNLDNTTGRKYPTGTTSAGEYGGYYTYDNAITVCTNLNSGGNSNWTLPTQAQYNTLISGLTNTTITQSPYNFKYGGYSIGSAPLDTGNYGYYWSSTPNGSSDAWYLYFNTNGRLRVGLNGRSLGYSVRCVVSGN